jgi:pimeloyl-ACP methyl ester carboxylesterase
VSPHVTTTGDPADPAVVLLHGLGVSSWMWDDQVAALSDRFHCIAIDLPGNGGSHAVPWESTAGTAAVVADVVADTAAGGTAHVVGLSLGGYVALALLAAHPERVRSAVVSGVTTDPLRPAWLYGALVRANLRLLDVPAFVRASARMMGIPEQARAAYVADAARMSRDGARRVYAELLHHRTPDLGPHADRVLAVAGDREVRAAHAALRRLAAAGATAALAPRAHHAWNGEHPELFSRMVRDWALDRALPPELVPVAAGTGSAAAGGRGPGTSGRGA